MSEHSINVRAGIALAVVLSLLAASAGPVTAANVSTSAVADELVVGSQHDTTDELSAGTLDNLTVESGTVTLNGGITAGWTAESGDSFTASTSHPKSGTYSGEYSVSGSGWGNAFIWKNISTQPAVQTSVWTYDPDSDSSQENQWLALRDASADSQYVIGLNPQNGDFYIRAHDSSGTTKLDSTGVSTSIQSYYKINATYDRSSGQITATLEAEDGSTLGTISATDTSIRPTHVGLGQYRGTAYYDDAKVNSSDDSSNGVSNATYLSANHSVSNPQVARVNITEIANMSAKVTVTPAGSNTILNQTTVTTTGNHSLNLSTTTATELVVNVSLSKIGSNPKFTLADESILFTNHAPEADNLSPPDGTELTQSTVDFSVDVSDAEFTTAQGDTVTAELFVDGSSVGAETVTSNQTVTISHELTQGGDHTYHWELSDSYGATTSTPTNTVTVPAELEVWDVNNDTLIDQGNATVTFFGGDNEQQIVEREVTNGTVSLAGLPTDTEFTVAVRAEGYFTRQVIITSLYEQSRVWMLSKSVSDAVEVTFRLDDRTGEFANSDETQLRVQRPITINNTTEWRDVIGDDISATSDLATVLQNDQRYRLIIENDVQSRILGSYTPSGPADPEVIPIGRVNFQADTEAGTALDASLLNETSPAVRVMFRDPDQQATSLKYRITNTTEGANSTVVVANMTVSDPGGFTSVTEVLPEGTTLDDSTYLVELWAYQDGELMEKQSVSVGQLSGPGDWTAGVNEGLLNLAGFVLIVSTGYGTANYKPELGALVAVIFGGALTLLNVVAIPHVILGFTGTIALIVNTADTT
jgi:hypothetical protein